MIHFTLLILGSVLMCGQSGPVINMKRSVSHLDTDSDGYTLDKRAFNTLGQGNLFKRSMDNLGGGNLLRSLDLGNGNLLKRSIGSLGGGNLLRSMDSLGQGNLLRSAKADELYARRLDGLGYGNLF